MPKVILLKNKTSPIDLYDVEFTRINWHVEFFPILEHEPVDPDGLKKYLESDEFRSADAIIITSQRAVEALNSHIARLSDSSRRFLLNTPIYTVGPATAKILKDAGYSDIRGGINAGNGDILSNLIIKEFKENNTLLKTFVFFTGETRRDVIPVRINQTSGMSLTEKIVYKTRAIYHIKPRFEETISAYSSATIQREGSPWIVFFSPASSEDIVQILQQTPRNKFRLAAIGPTTEKYLKANNLLPDAIAAIPDAAHLIEAILKNQTT